MEQHVGPSQVRRLYDALAAQGQDEQLVHLLTCPQCYPRLVDLLEGLGELPSEGGLDVLERL